MLYYLYNCILQFILFILYYIKKEYYIYIIYVEKEKLLIIFEFFKNEKNENLIMILIIKFFYIIQYNFIYNI